MYTRLLSLLAVCGVAVATPTPAPPDSLRLVHLLYRHGARTPIHPYPTDPNTAAWPQGSGQLTNEGKRNQLELGGFLRSRYDGFLPAEYHLNYTHVESTDVDRTLMSAQANLAGLYPPRGDDVWDAQLPWQPVPVHTRPAQIDLKLKSYDSCAAYVAERARVDASANMTALNARYADLYGYLAEHSGSSVASVKDVSYLYDTLSIEASNNLTTPAWALASPPGYTAPAFPDLMKPLTDLDFGLFGATPLQRRLGGGPLLADMVAHMGDAVAGTLEPAGRRLFAYSAHDTNVACLLTTLGLYNGLAPPLASCVLVELHAEGAAPSGFAVQLWYRNTTAAQPYPLQLPGCQLSCPWAQFVSLTADVVPTDVAQECVGGGR